MSIVYARQVAGCTFFLADTASEVASTQEMNHALEEPLVKIVPLPTAHVVAYAGNSYLAEQALRENANASGDDLENALLKSHVTERAVDYLLYRRDTGALLVFSEGVSQAVSVGHIGSQPAFERLQKIRHSPPGNDAVMTSAVKLADLGEEVPPEYEAEFGRSFDAFRRLPNEGIPGIGGFVVPFVVRQGKAGFVSYAFVLRGAIREEELVAGAGLGHEDDIRGAYIVEFGGSQERFVVFHPKARMGHVYRGILSSGVECDVYKNIDGYDFADCAETIGVELGPRTWDVWQQALAKAMQRVKLGNAQAARPLIEKSFETLERRLADGDGAIEIGLDAGLLEPLIRSGEIAVSIDTVNLITALLNASYAYWDHVGNKVAAARWLRDLKYWSTTTSQKKLKLTMPPDRKTGMASEEGGSR